MPTLAAADSLILCPHGGTIVATLANTRIVLNGLSVLQPNAIFTILGCVNNPPCDNVNWTSGSQRVLVQGQPVLLQSSVGVCSAGGFPTGLAIISSTQTRTQGN